MASPQTQNGFIQIATELYNALCKVRIPGEAEQVIKAIIRFTYGFNRTRNTISTKQFIECTGLPKRSIYRGIKRLRKMNMIGVKIDTGVQLATKKATTYWLQKDYDKWSLGVQIDTGVKKCQNTVSKLTPAIVVINNTIDKGKLPAPLNNPQFKTAWIDWQAYLKERHKPLTKQGAEKLLNRLSGDGSARAIAAINYSISQGYTGIYEEDKKGTKLYGKDLQSELNKGGTGKVVI